MRTRSLLVGLLAAAMLAPWPASAATTEVQVKDFQFVPPTAGVTVGDAVHWSRQAGSVATHSVTANNGFFDTGAPTGGDIDLTATFSAGTFHYYCIVHGSPTGSPSSGMNGLIRVPASIITAPSGPPFTVRWATAGTDTGGRFDVQYRVGSGKWQTWKSKTTSLKGLFGKNGKPVGLKHTAYSFRARSRTSSGPSGWSPRAAFTP